MQYLLTRLTKQHHDSFLEDLTWGTLALVNDGSNEVHSGRNYEDWEPSAMRLRDQLCSQRAAHDAWNCSLKYKVSHSSSIWSKQRIFI